MSATVAEPVAVWQRLRDSVPAVVHAPDLRQRRYILRRERTEESLARLFVGLKGPRKVLVFCNSRRASEQLASVLREANAFDGRVFVHHSSLDRAVRLDVENQLRSPERALCVATSTLELGIDIGDVDLVVLHSPPSDWKSFSQRLGRGNRRSDTVDVLCLIGPWSERPAWEASVFLALAHQLEGRSAREADDGPLYGSASQQVVSHLRGGGDWETRGSLLKALGEDTEPILEDIIAELIEFDILQRHPVQKKWGLSFGFDDVEKRMEAWGNFPTSSSKLSVVERGRTLGEIAYGNVMRLAPGVTFGLQGRVWKVLGIFRNQVKVEQTAGRPGVQLIYDALGARLDPTLVELVPRVVQSPADLFSMNSATAKWWTDASRQLGASLVEGVPVWREGADWVHASFAGRLLNEAILRLLNEGGTATESTFALSRKAMLSDLPPFGPLWLDAVSDFLENPGELTTWQQRLPARLLREELLGPFLTHPVYPRIIDRLRSAEVHELEDDRLTALVPMTRPPRKNPTEPAGTATQ